MRAKILAGTTSYSQPIYVTNSSAGGGLGSLVFNTASLVGEYRRAGSSTWTSISLVTAVLGTWTSGGWIADGSLTGAYEVGIPNAALASGEPWVAIRFYGATNMTPVLLYVELDAVNYQDAVHFGLSAIPNVAPGVASGLMINGTNAGAILFSGGMTVSNLSGSALTLTSGGSNGNGLVCQGNGSGTGISGNITGNITGNLVGTVSTLTTYTGNTPQTGDSFARIGSTGSALTSLASQASITTLSTAVGTPAQAATALSTAQWSNTRAGFLDNLSGGAVALASGVVLTSAGMDAVVVEVGLNARQSLSVIAAACGGVSSGVNAGSPVYKGAGVAATRITATASNGDRSAVTLSPPA